MADPNKLLQQANEFDSTGQFAEAAKIYQELLSVTANEVHGKLNLYMGVSYFNAGETDLSLEAFQQAIDSGDTEILANAIAGKARALEKSNRLDEAAESFKAGLEFDSEGKFLKWSDYAHCLNQNNQFEKALEAAATGLEIQPQFAPQLRNERIFSFFKLEKPLDALEDVEAILKIKSASELRPEELQLYSEVLLQTGQDNLNNGKLLPAKEYLQRVCDLNLTTDSAFLLGICDFRLNELPSAISNLKKAIELDSANWRARVALGMIFVRPETADYASASEQFVQAMKTSQEAVNPNVHFNNGYALYRLEQTQLAKPSLEFVFQNDKANWMNSALLGTITLGEKDYHKTIEYLSHAIEASNGAADDSIHYNLAYAYMMLGMYKEAMESFQKAVEKNPDNIAAAKAATQMKHEYEAEQKRLKEEEEKRKQEELARVEAERKRQEALKLEELAKKEKDKKIRQEKERKAKQEREKAEEAIREAAKQKEIKKREAAERRMKRLQELTVQIGGPQTYRARRKSLELIPKGNTGKNAHAYADWYNDKIVNGKK